MEAGGAKLQKNVSKDGFDISDVLRSEAFARTFFRRVFGTAGDDEDDDADDHTVIIIHYTPTILCSNSNYRVIVCLALKT